MNGTGWNDGAPLGLTLSGQPVHLLVSSRYSGRKSGKSVFAGAVLPRMEARIARQDEASRHYDAALQAFKGIQMRSQELAPYRLFGTVVQEVIASTASNAQAGNTQSLVPDIQTKDEQWEPWVDSSIPGFRNARQISVDPWSSDKLSAVEDEVARANLRQFFESYKPLGLDEEE